MTTVLRQQRANRFRRSAAPAPMQLTARDIKLLAHVARHRFLTSAQLVALDGGSPQNVLRALRALYDHQYLDRPLSQIASMIVGGSRPLVYGLGKNGARALRAHGQTAHDVDWTEKNRRAGAIFIEHTLELAGFMTSLELACAAHNDVRLIEATEIIEQAPETTRRAREPLRWQTEQIQRGRKEVFSVVPDGLFGLAFPDNTASYFLLEIDRGTIPLRRTDTYGTAAWRKNIEYKLRTYYEGWRADRHVQQFGVKQLRVLWITNSQARLEHMIDLQRGVTDGKGSALFLFACSGELRSASPLELSWISGRKETVQLLN